MNTKARYFIGLTIASGAALLASSMVGAGDILHSNVYLSYFVLAVLGSALKIRLPGLTGTMSVNFFFILISIAVFTFSETVLLTALACVVQCTCRTTRRPKLVQVAFNVATLVISSALAYRAAHYLTGGSESHLGVMLALAAFLYFTANTFLVSGVLFLVERKPLMGVWQQCYLWTFPYYLVGASIAALVVFTSRSVGWAMSLLVLPLMYLVYLFYRMCVERLGERMESRTA
jgi:hypothetical protein